MVALRPGWASRWLSQKESASGTGEARDWFLGSLGQRKFPGVGNGNLFRYSAQKVPWTEEPGGKVVLGAANNR